MKRLALLLATSLLAVGASAWADPVVDPPHVSTQQARLGEPITLDVLIPGAVQETWRAKPFPAESPFSLLSQQATPAKGGTDLQVRVGLYSLGPQALPPLTLVSSSGRELVVPPGPAPIVGISDLGPGKPELRPLAGPRVPQVFAWRFVLVTGALALLAALVIAVGLRRFFRWRASEEKRDRRALERLIGDPCSDLEFYLALDGIVRRYLERRHGIPAPERTSSELVDAITTQPLLPAQELTLLLREADLVKFAARPAHPGRRDADGALALRLVSQPRSSPRSPRDSHARPALS